MIVSRIILWRIIAVLVLMSGIGGCCGEHLNLWNIHDINVVVVRTETNEVVDSSITITNNSEFRIVVVNEIEFVSIFNPGVSDFFIQRGLAFQCPDSGEDGMQDPISELNVFSNNDYNNISAGELLNDIVIVENTLSIEELISLAPDLRPTLGKQLSLTLSERPENSAHIFTIEIVTQSGNVFRDESIEIKWE
jgi:hypothetical protein